MHKERLIILFLLLSVLLLAGCSGEEENDKVELADPIGGSSILTAADLLAFVERGESDTANLSADISLENEMLCITEARDGLTINGNGFTLSSAGDCVIRLDDGCSVTLNDMVIHGGSDAIGCLGDGAIGGSGLRIIGIGNGVRANGAVTILPDSSISVTGTAGSGLVSHALLFSENAELTLEGPLGGADISGDILLAQGAKLSAYTEENYNALKCDGTLAMQDGASLTVENRGSYHGAELTDLVVEGTVYIDAKGGENSSGLFLFEQLEDIYVVGSCSPEPRFESGRGSITFVDSPADIPAPEEEDASEDSAEGEEADAE